MEDKEREQREFAAVKVSATIAQQSEADVGATEMETIPISIAPLAEGHNDGGVGTAPVPGGLQTILSAAEIESMLSEASTPGDDGGVAGNTEAPAVTADAPQGALPVRDTISK